MTLSESVSRHASPSLNCVSVRSPAASAEAPAVNCDRKAMANGSVSLKASSPDCASRVAVVTPVRSKSRKPLRRRVEGHVGRTRQAAVVDMSVGLGEHDVRRLGTGALTPKPISPTAAAIEAAMARDRILACWVASSACRRTCW